MTAPDQGEFIAALLNPGAPVPSGLTDGARNPAARRFDVYRNNVAVSLTEAMHTAFPVVTRLLGATNMDGLAGIYLRAHPPRTPLMMHYGADFPAFLAALPQLAHLKYLPDVARLELAMRRSYHAADAKGLNPAALAAVTPERLGDALLGLAPATEVIISGWPLFDIWAFNAADGPKPRAEAQDVIVTRPEFDPMPHLLPSGGAAFVQALAGGETLGAAMDRAGTGFDLPATLTLLLSQGAITSLTMKDP
ncbi:MAG: DNA-binding domain-containing protein [Rhodobacteraceae bacterium]|nr:DNA-binding domain-containing protein [Paracoccaceae bacterium]